MDQTLVMLSNVYYYQTEIEYFVDDDDNNNINDDSDIYNKIAEIMNDIKNDIYNIRKMYNVKKINKNAIDFVNMTIEFLKFKKRELYLYLYSPHNIIYELKKIEGKIDELMVNFIEKSENMAQQGLINEFKYLDICNKIKLLRSKYHNFYYINNEVYIKLPESEFLYPKPDNL
jgi:hypothetical protein